jgi:hypothetical protein
VFTSQPAIELAKTKMAATRPMVHPARDFQCIR